MSAKTPADKLQMKAFTVVMRSPHGKLMFTVLARSLAEARALAESPRLDQMGQYPTDWHSRFSHVTVEEEGL